MAVLILFSCSDSRENKSLKEQDQLTDKPYSKRTIKENTEKTTKVYDRVISIAELRENKDKYKNAIIQLNGVVTRYNPNIMNINWVHIQDGSEFDGKKYIAMTTAAEVTIGDTIRIKGKVSLDKDLGRGYVYDILVENVVIE